MPSRFFKILILIGGFLYLHSAFEFSNDYVKNTWGDEYDTYIHSDQTTNASSDISHVTILLPFVPFTNFNFLPQDLFFSSFICQNWKPPINQKTYLKNSALLI